MSETHMVEYYSAKNKITVWIKWPRNAAIVLSFSPPLSSMLTNFLLITTSLSFGESFPTLCYPGGLTSSLLTGEHMTQNGLVTTVPVHGNWSKEEYFFFFLCLTNFSPFTGFSQVKLDRCSLFLWMTLGYWQLQPPAGWVEKCRKREWR